MRKMLHIVVTSLILLCTWGVSGVLAQSGTERPFITKWQGEAGKELKLPIVGTYKMVIKDGSGTEKLNETVTVVDAENPYIFTPTKDGTYTVEAGPEGVKYMRMRVEWTGYWRPLGSNDKLLEVVQFGTVKWESMKKMFTACHHITFAAGIDTPDLSKVTNMEEMFGNCSAFNQPLNEWKVSNVTNMVGMFRNCSSFNQPLEKWKVDNVIDMGAMFDNCSAFNQPLDNWNVSKVTSMSDMFAGCSAFNQPLNSWNVSNVTEMWWMFSGCTAFNQPLDNWKVDNVTNMEGIFAGCTSFNQPLDNWKVDNVTDMHAMFSGCTAFNQSLNNWKVDNVTDMHAMFSGCTAFNQPLNNWKVDNVTNMEEMFSGCTAFNQPLNNWKVDNVTNMEEMFSGCSSFNQPLGNWNVSNVAFMERMFADCSSFNQPLNSWNVSKVTYMRLMFRGCASFNQPLDKWDVSNVTDMYEMFAGCASFNQPLGSWKIKTAVEGLSTTAMSPLNYSQTLVGWAEQMDITKDLDFKNNVEGLVYNDQGKAAREKLMGKGWKFNGDTHQPNGVAITPHTLPLVLNKEFTLLLNKWGVVETTEEVSLSTNTEGIISYELTADKKGVHIKGLKVGECELTATIAAKAGVHEAYTSTCSISVYIPIERFTITPASKTLKVGEEITLTANIFPENATKKNVRWHSNNYWIATVDDDTGKVTAKRAGRCTIDAEIEEYGRLFYGECYVTVVKESAPVASITIPEKQTITVGTTILLIAVVKPDNAEQELVWSSSDPEVAMVSGGVVWGKKKGECTITVKSLDPNCTITKECKIFVEEPSNGENNGSGENNGGGNSGGNNGGNNNGGNGGGNNGGNSGNNGGGNSGGNSGNNGGGNGGNTGGNNGGGNNNGNNGNGDNNGSNPTTFSVTLARPANGKIEIEGYATKSSITVAKDTKLTVKATPDEGYKLKSLKAGDEDITTTLKFTVKAATTITAVFEKKTFAVTTSVNNEAWGSIELTGASNLKAVVYDTELTVKVTEKEGYKLKSLTAGDEDIITTKKFIVKAATEVKAVFESKQGGAVEDALLAGISVAPNPFTTQLRILNPEGVAAHYELVNASGIVVRSGALSGSEAIVDTETLPSDIYFVRLEAQNGAQKSVMVSK